LVIDVSVSTGKGDEFVLELFDKMPRPRIAVLNKVDLVEKHLLLPRMAALSARNIFEELVPVSALKEDNLETLRALLFKYLPEGDELYPAGTLTTSPEESRAAEIIREKFLNRTREEIPYGLGVVIEEMAPGSDKNITVIRAAIVVDRESHKKIVLGRAGSLIKECGMEARLELEKTFSRRFYLELVVMARPGWREDPRFLSRLTS
jgi:GTP-binding protein Era